MNPNVPQAPAELQPPAAPPPLPSSSYQPGAPEHAADDQALPPPPPPLTTLSGRAFKRPTKIACVGCRAIKVKCRLPNGEIPTGEWDKDLSKCARCIRLKLPCEFQSAPRRGRKPKDRSGSATFDGAAASSSGSMHTVPPTSGVAADPTAPAYSLPHPQPVPSGSTAPASNVPLPPTWPLPHGAVPYPHLPYPHPSPFGPAPQLPIPPQPPSWPRSNPTHSSPALSAHAQPSPASLAGSTSEPAQTMLSLAEAADVKSSSFTTDRPSLLHSLAKGKKPTTKMPDPVDMRALLPSLVVATPLRSSRAHFASPYADVLTALEAAQLFHYFHAHLNCYIVLFDRHLHTADYGPFALSRLATRECRADSLELPSSPKHVDGALHGDPDRLGQILPRRAVPAAPDERAAARHAGNGRRRRAYAGLGTSALDPDVLVGHFCLLLCRALDG